jgi:hypothetical protein
MKRPRLYAELFAGSFAVGLRLLGARRPPVAYMGAKTSIASQILGVLGLHPGRGADACLLVDAGPWGWAWATLLDPTGRAEVAAILRSWAGEDPHALWMRLAASPPPSSPASATATYLWLQARSASCTPVWWDDGGALVMPTGARWRDSVRPATQKGVSFGGGSMRSPGTVAERIDAVATLDWPAVEVLEAHPEPADVATWLCLQQGNAFSKPVDVEDGRWSLAGYAHQSVSSVRRGWRGRLNMEEMARNLDRLPGVDGTIAHGFAAAPKAGADLEGCVVYLDPPYVGCTSYAAACPREEVVRLAKAYAAAGALVAISEATALVDDLPGWHAVNLTHERTGQRWTERRVKGEWLTLSQEPAWMPTGAQERMFAETSA